MIQEDWKNKFINPMLPPDPKITPFKRYKHVFLCSLS